MIDSKIHRKGKKKKVDIRAKDQKGGGGGGN